MSRGGGPCPRHLDPVWTVPQAQVAQDDVRPQLCRQLHRTVAVGGLADHLDRGLS